MVVTMVSVIVGCAILVASLFGTIFARSVLDDGVEGGPTFFTCLGVMVFAAALVGAGWSAVMPAVMVEHQDEIEAWSEDKVISEVAESDGEIRVTTEDGEEVCLNSRKVSMAMGDGSGGAVLREKHYRAFGVETVAYELVLDGGGAHE